MIVKTGCGTDGSFYSTSVCAGVSNPLVLVLLPAGGDGGPAGGAGDHPHHPAPAARPPHPQVPQLQLC